jgi:toxin ParE1/3/4
MLAIERRRVFINELLDIAEFIGQDDYEAGARFIDACEQTFLELAEMPLLGSPRAFSDSELQGIRMWHVKGYADYLIFYRPTKTSLRLLHIVHGARSYRSLFDRK